MDDWHHIPYFANISANTHAQLHTYTRYRQFQAGAFIFREGEACAGFFIVAEGLVRIYRANGEGRLHTLSLLRPITSFNEVAAVDGRYNPFNAVAVTYSTVWHISHTHLISLMAGDRQLLQNYVQQLAHQNRDYLERLEDMTFRSIPARLAKLFLHETTYAEHITEAPTKLTQEEIAAILGTTREVVGRALRGLLNGGYLRKKGREIVIADRDGLERLAETHPTDGLYGRD